MSELESFLEYIKYHINEVRVDLKEDINKNNRYIIDLYSVIENFGNTNSKNSVSTKNLKTNNSQSNENKINENQNIIIEKIYTNTKKIYEKLKLIDKYLFDFKKSDNNEKDKESNLKDNTTIIKNYQNIIKNEELKEKSELNNDEESLNNLSSIHYQEFNPSYSNSGRWVQGDLEMGMNLNNSMNKLDDSKQYENYDMHYPQSDKSWKLKQHKGEVQVNRRDGASYKGNINNSKDSQEVFKKEKNYHSDIFNNYGNGGNNRMRKFEKNNNQNYYQHENEVTHKIDDGIVFTENDSYKNQNNQNQKNINIQNQNNQNQNNYYSDSEQFYQYYFDPRI